MYLTECLGRLSMCNESQIISVKGRKKNLPPLLWFRSVSQRRNGRPMFDRRVSAFLLCVSVFVTSVMTISLSLANEAAGTETIKLGLLLPQAESTLLDSAVIRGATLAIEEANALAGFFGKSFELVPLSIKDETNAAVEARRAVEEEGVVALIGNLNLGEWDAVCSVAQEMKFILINCGGKDELRTSKSNRYCFHFEAGKFEYIRALGEYLVGERKLGKWVFVRPDDREGRKLEETLRSILSEVGGELVETVSLSADVPTGKSHLGLVRSARPDLVLIGLLGEQQAEFVESYLSSGRSQPLAIVDLSKEILTRLDDDPLEVDLFWADSWHQSLFRYSARELNSRYLKRFKVPMDGESWVNWAAVKFVSEAVIRTQSADSDSLIFYFESQPPFDGHKGFSLIFELKRRQLSHTLYVLKQEKSDDKYALKKPEIVFRHRMSSK